MQFEPIIFPAIVCSGRTLVCTGKDIVNIWGIRHEGGNRFSYKESVKDDHRFHWIIDAHGAFREITDCDRTRDWARFLSPLIVLTRRQCEVKPPVRLTIGDLKGRLKNMNRSGTGKDFYVFLKQYEESDPFTADLFRLFMNESDDTREERFPWA